MRSFLISFFFITSLFYNRDIGAQNLTCPKVISTFANNLLAKDVGTILSRLYQELGCPIQLSPLPNKRSIVRFNKKDIDGEIFRHDAVEKHYSVPFVRSSKPLFILKSSIFKNKKIEETRPLGYVRGIVWQEEYITSKNKIAFSSNHEMLNAFNRGAIGSFMANNISFKKLVKEGQIVEEGIQYEVVYSAPLYHYLQEDFADFMHALSDKIEQKNAFTNF